MKCTYVLMMILFAIPLSGEEDNLTVIYDGETIDQVDRSEFMTSLIGEPVLDVEKFAQFIDKVDEKVYQKPVNAKLEDGGNIVEGQLGYKLNRDLFSQLFHNYFFGRGPGTIEVPVVSLYPKVDTELLANIRIKQIGQYLTYFNKKNEERANNIALAVDAIDNHVVFPGETFSFNEVVGKRTSEKGYLSAPIIIKGKLFEGIGGGICQVSSTLFNAVDRAGVEIVQRYTHSKRVPYVPPGRDATVSWYGPDFKFKNGYNQPILIRAKTRGGMVTIQVYSSESINYEPRSPESKAPERDKKNEPSVSPPWLDEHHA